MTEVHTVWVSGAHRAWVSCEISFYSQRATFAPTKRLHRASCQGIPQARGQEPPGHRIDRGLFADPAGCDEDRAGTLEEIVAGAACTRQEGAKVSSGSLTTLIVLVTLIHVAALVIMIVIRVRRNEVDGTTGDGSKITPCAVCGEPATRRRYDGLDPDERRDPHTGRPYSTNLIHYQPLCAAH